MITTLTILGTSNWNEMEIYLMLWMWWRMWQTYATTMTQMMTATMTTLMRKKTPKTKRIPVLPTHKWEDGGYGQRLSHRSRNRSSCFFGSCCCCICVFSPNLGEGVWFWCLGAFWGRFLEHWCVCGVRFLFLSITSA